MYNIKKTKVLLVCPMLDGQSGTYLHDSLVELKNNVAYYDWRYMMEQNGPEKMNEDLIEAVKNLKPDITIIIKGVGILPDTIKKMREVHKHHICGWIFDVTLGGTMVAEILPYVEFLKQLDVFYTIDNDAISPLKKLGVNAEWLTEGCFLPAHKETIFNSVQRRKYGAEVVFLGAVGSIHKNRESFLKRLWEEGIPFKLYGHVGYLEKEEPDWVKDSHTGFEAINDYHSLVCQSSKIVIGLDGWPDRSKAWSARLYRTLCPGGFYLTTHTKDIEKYFEPGKHLDTFKNEDEMIEKILYYLQNDDLREKIAKEGQKEVIENYQFKHRLQQILKNAGFDKKQ